MSLETDLDVFWDVRFIILGFMVACEKQLSDKMAPRILIESTLELYRN